ncbi:MAG: carbon-nitrogen family hydrolase [Anaerolineae bacterium]|nr:carbon-nitrogen family hydrolase [Anaerolineae bacterium]
MSTLTVSLIQFDVQSGAPAHNLAAVQPQIADAAQQGADLVILPELWDAGIAYHRGQELASRYDEGLFAELTDLADQHGVHIMGSLYEQGTLGIHNTLAVVAPGAGVVGTYRKIHLFPLMNENRWLTPGETPVALDLPWGRTGLAICYDLRFPELFREYAAAGASLVVLPMAWPHPRLMHFQTLIRARAIENQCYMVAVNHVGQETDGTRYFGHSCVIDPWGNVVVEAGETACHLTVTLDMDLVAEVRAALPALEDRRL